MDTSTTDKATNPSFSEKPKPSLMDEFYALNHDKKKSLQDLHARYQASALLTRAEYYFLIFLARNATFISKVERIQHASIQTALEMTQELWALCKRLRFARDQQDYFLGNLNAYHHNSPASKSLDTHIPEYIQASKRHPNPITLELALRNPEVMLREDLAKASDEAIHEKLKKYLPDLFRMAARRFYLETGEPFMIAAENMSGARFSKYFGHQNTLELRERSNSCIGLWVRFDHFSMASSNIIEVEDFITAFSTTRLDSFTAGDFHIMHDNQSLGHGQIQIRIGRVETTISRGEYDRVSTAIEEMLANPQAQAALAKTYEYYGNL